MLPAACRTGTAKLHFRKFEVSVLLNPPTMKKLSILLLALPLLLASCAHKTEPVAPAPAFDSSSIYSYSYTDIDGRTVKLADLKGKKIMFVNTASYCVNTPQYAGLERLYQRYKDRLVIIGFPCDDFGHQEPGTVDEIKEVCQNYSISFPMSQKIAVLGNGIHPIYRWLTTQSLNGRFSSTVDWNFQKYLVDANGTLVAKFENYTDPEDPAIVSEVGK